ncbi:MAG TPA: DUF2934 domain-containing protein [Lacunisphaera sp.]|jgi:hypothetical protein
MARVLKISMLHGMKRTASSSPSNSPNYVSPSNVIDSSREPFPLVRHATYEEISARAYQLWQESGQVHDQHLDHWNQAERELNEALAGQEKSIGSRQGKPPAVKTERQLATTFPQ